MNLIVFLNTIRKGMKTLFKEVFFERQKRPFFLLADIVSQKKTFLTECEQ